MMTLWPTNLYRSRAMNRQKGQRSSKINMGVFISRLYQISLDNVRPMGYYGIPVRDDRWCGGLKRSCTEIPQKSRGLWGIFVYPHFSLDKFKLMWENVVMRLRLYILLISLVAFGCQLKGPME